MKKTLFLINLIFACFAIRAEKLSVSQVYNPKEDGQNIYVSDVNNVLSPNTKEIINEKCTELEKNLGVEFAIVIVPGIEGDDEYDFAYKLFNNWRIGKSSKNNGLLWLYVEDIRAMKLETGLGLEGILTDAFLNRVLDETVFPLMKKNETDAAFYQGLTKIYGKLTTDEAREELLLKPSTTRSLIGNIFLGYLGIGFIILIIVAVMFYKKTNILGGSNNIQYFRAKAVTDTTKICAVLFPIPILFFWLYEKKYQDRIRLKPIKCSKCGEDMHRLSEIEEDEFLNQGQQAEENVKSVDYDVWKCEKCGDIKVLAYTNLSTKYTKCPHCGAKTYTLVDDNVIRSATTLSTGKGEKIYECAHCKYKKVVPYVIPLIVVVSSGSGGSSGGIGGGSGSFGGGMSGGGGAGGRF